MSSTPWPQQAISTFVGQDKPVTVTSLYLQNLSKEGSLLLLGYV